MKLDIKRLYLPLLLIQECPKCKKVLNKDLNNEYISYPEIGVNSKNEIYFWCKECDHEFAINYRLNFSLEMIRTCTE